MPSPRDPPNGTYENIALPSLGTFGNASANAAENMEAIAMPTHKRPSVKIDIKQGVANASSAPRPRQWWPLWTRFSRHQIIVAILVCAVVTTGILAFGLTLKLLKDSRAAEDSGDS